MRTIILIGFMGAGKTTIGTRLAEKTGLLLVDTDAMIEEMAQMTISQIFALKGEEAFRATETRVLEELLNRKEELVISVGGGLPMREENRRLLKQLGTVVYLKVSAETVLKRLEGDTTRPLLAGPDGKERVSSLLKERGPVYEEAADMILKVDGKDVEGLIKELEERMEGQK